MGRKAYLRGTTQIADIQPAALTGYNGPNRLPYSCRFGLRLPEDFQQACLRSSHLSFALFEDTLCLLVPIIAVKMFKPNYIRLYRPLSRMQSEDGVKLDVLWPLSRKG